MFRQRDQASLFISSNLLPPEKQQRMEQTWAWPFREKALGLIEEQSFADFYHVDNGRPNKPVQTVVGVLILKEMFDLTDQQALDELEYDARRQVALDLTPEEAHSCQKTLHNFRVKGLEQKRGGLLFSQITDGIAAALGQKTTRQRLDSTHIVSNIRQLTRLGLFCQTTRLFLTQLRAEQEALFQAVPVSWRRRYLKEDGQATAYEDGKKEQVRRRLPVVARDLWRLIDRFRGHEQIAGWESYQLLQRLLDEQCVVLAKADKIESEAADAGDSPAPVGLREPKEIKANSLQSPHDPDATYGHKGKGYEVQVAETFGNKSEEDPDKPELITHVSVTPSAGSDADAVQPVLADLAERDQKPAELVADTTYASTQNVLDAEQEDVELVGPVAGNQPLPSDEEVTVGDFEINVDDGQQSRCPMEHAPAEQTYDSRTGRVRLTFTMATCRDCPLRGKCPVRTDPADRRQRVLDTDRKTAKLEQRRREQTSLEYRDRYANRAGIEATNSELKRGHGLGRLRVRGGARVELAVYLKATACNVKRYVQQAVRQAAQKVRAEAAEPELAPV